MIRIATQLLLPIFALAITACATPQNAERSGPSRNEAWIYVRAGTAGPTFFALTTITDADDYKIWERPLKGGNGFCEYANASVEAPSKIVLDYWNRERGSMSRNEKQIDVVPGTIYYFRIDTLPGPELDVILRKESNDREFQDCERVLPPTPSFRIGSP